MGRFSVGYVNKSGFLSSPPSQYKVLGELFIVPFVLFSLHHRTQIRTVKCQQTLALQGGEAYICRGGGVWLLTVLGRRQQASFR